MNGLRVGRVDYINTFPLAWSLADRVGEPAIDETLGVPTALNRMLIDGELDVANVSSIVYAQHADELVLLPSLCISSDGAVDSVQLVTDLPLPAIQTIAVTSESAASVALVRILFPEARIVPEGEPADARLLIGDRALRSALDDAAPHHDLGALWRERTGLPMVFAVWAARRDVDPERLAALDHALADALADASEHAALIARAASERYGFPAGFIARYFEKLRYRFGERERAGLAHYYALAAGTGLVDREPELAFIDRTAVES
jgi:chorismate dehydratase